MRGLQQRQPLPVSGTRYYVFVVNSVVTSENADSKLEMLLNVWSFPTPSLDLWIFLNLCLSLAEHQNSVTRLMSNPGASHLGTPHAMGRRY